MNKKLCDKLKYYRKTLGLTQEQVANAIGVNRSTYTYYERGSSSPNIETLMLISKVFNVDPYDLINNNESSEISFAQPEPDYRNVFYKDLDNEEDMSFSLLSKNEKELLCYFRVLSASQQDEVLSSMSERCEKKKGDK